MKETFSSRWSSYRPSKKTWLLSMIGASVLTMVIGFVGAGWMPSGRAHVMAEIAARNARNELAANICVEQFVSSTEAAQNLSKLKDTANWDRNKYIEDGGWLNIKGIDDMIPGASERCVKELIEIKELPVTGPEISDT